MAEPELDACDVDEAAEAFCGFVVAGCQPTAVEYNINLLSRYFPNARFVFQTRDAGAISRSGWWKQRPREAVEKFIKNADAAFLACAAKNDASIHVRYEDIVEGEGALRKVAEFLGEDFCTQAAHNIISERLSHLKKNS